MEFWLSGWSWSNCKRYLSLFRNWSTKNYFKTLKHEKEKIKKLILEEGLTITDVIDAVIELNGIIGVGLITLGEGLQEYVFNKIEKNPEY